MRMAFKGVPNGKGCILWDGQSVGRGKLSANVAPRVEGHLGVYSNQSIRRSSNWLQNGCRTWETVPALKLGIHPEMERSAILNKSMPSTAGATIRSRASPFCGRLPLLRVINLRSEEKRHLQLLEGVYQMGSSFSRIVCTSAHSWPLQSHLLTHQ